MITKAVVMAGGEGRRLRPLTEHVPKPLLEIGGRPLLQILIEHLRGESISDIHIAVGYKGELISECFSDGSHLSVSIKYTREKKRMGTAGALSLYNNCLSEPFYLINGDILTTMKFSDMGKFHKDSGADVTVGVVEHEVLVPYGVVQIENGYLLDVTEKPIVRFLVLGGVYVLNPSVLSFVPKNRALDMPDLIQLLIEKKKKVAHFTIRSGWMDVGTNKDLEIAQSKVFEWGILRHGKYDSIYQRPRSPRRSRNSAGKQKYSSRFKAT